MFSTLQRKIEEFFNGKIGQSEIIIPHGRSYFIPVVRKMVTVLNEGVDESGTIFKISGTPRQISKLKKAIGENP